MFRDHTALDMGCARIFVVFVGIATRNPSATFDEPKVLEIPAGAACQIVTQDAKTFATMDKSGWVIKCQFQLASADAERPACDELVKGFGK